MSLFVGVDVGTQGAKALVYDAAQRRVLSRGSSPYDIIKTNVVGRAEQHPSTWIEGSVAALKEALEHVDRKAVRGMSISGQQHGMVPLDRERQVIRNAKLWCDVEAAAEAEELSRAFSCTVVPGFTAPKILWLKRHEPDNWARLAHVLLPHDYVNYWLTGRMAMECGDASGTGVFDTAGRRFDEARMAAVDERLAGFFPELVGPNEVIGEVLPAVAEQLGLPPGVLVGPGGGDNMMSALGSGAVREGVLVLSLGTSGTLFGVSSRPIVDPSGCVAPFCDSTGQWLPLLCTQNCTLVLEEVRQAFGSTHEELTRLAAQEPAGSDGVNFLPYLTGERTPNWPHATGALLGIRPGLLARPGLLYRAAMEGATFSLLAGYKQLQRYGLQGTALYVVGGGSKNALWRRIISDAFQLPLHLPLEPESAALGAALQAAAVANGVPVADFVEDHRPPLADEGVSFDEAGAAALSRAFERHLKCSEELFA